MAVLRFPHACQQFTFPTVIGGCRNTPLPAPFTYRETAAPAFLYRHAPFLLLGFMFQLIARHLLHTLNIIVVESFTTPHHYCPMSVQPLPAFTVTNLCYAEKSMDRLKFM